MESSPPFILRGEMNRRRTLFDSVVDPSRRTLDPSVFSLDESDSTGRPKLLPETRDTILTKASEYIQFGAVTKLYIIGSILSYQWTDFSDIDVHLEMPEGRVSEAIRKATEEAEEFLLPSTKHPVNFFVERDLSSDYAHADGVYDLYTDEWVRGPYNLSANLNKYMEEFRRIAGRIDLVRGELRRDIIDYEKLSRLGSNDVINLNHLLKEKLREINESVRELDQTYRIFHTLRSLGFRKKSLSPEQAKEIISRQLLPSNIIFKLLQKYHYIELLRAVRRVLITSSGWISGKDVSSLKDIL